MSQTCVGTGPAATREANLAGYRLLATYLVWDFKDLLQHGSLSEPIAQQRISDLTELFQKADSSNENYDRSTFSVVNRLFDLEEQSLQLWFGRALRALQEVKEGGFTRPSQESQRFIKQELQPFLRRLERA